MQNVEDSSPSAVRKDPLLVSILDAFDDGVAVLDHKLNFLYVNEALEKILGLDKADFAAGIRHMADKVGVNSNASATMNALKSKLKHTTLLRRSWRGERVLSSCTPILDNVGDVKYLVLNVRSMTGLNYLGYEVERQGRTRMSYTDFKIQRIRSQLDSAGFPDFVIASPATLEMMDNIIRVAPYNTTVLIQGETGVGKTQIAQIIHSFSERRQDAFVDINVGSIPQSLFESIFFGYEKGAFSGGERTGKAGIVGAAEGGTLFLDEIETLPLDLQGKILKLVDEKRYTKVGGSTVLTANIKVIAGSNVPLQHLVKEGAFRADLFYRLDEIDFHVPPLRERREEIPLLVAKVQERLLKKYGFMKEIEKDAIDLLLDYKFPGNIRELNNILEKAYAMDRHFVINREGLDKYLSAEGAERSGITHESLDIAAEEATTAAAREAAAMAPVHEASAPTGLHAIKEQIKQKELRQLIELYYKYGSTHRVAKEIGVSQPTVWRKLRGYINGKHAAAKTQ